MILIIAAVIAGLIMVFFMSKRTKDDDDPVWQTVLAVDELADEVAHWETSLWSLWVVALVENLLYRLDVSERVCYLNRIEEGIIRLQQGYYKDHPMSKKEVGYPYFNEEDTDLQNP